MNAPANRGRLAATAMVLVVTCCLARPGAAPGAAPEDACALLTPAQVSATLGAQVDPGERMLPTDPRFCSWHEHGKPREQGRNLHVSYCTARQYEVGRTSVNGIAKTQESGLGDDAYFSKVPGMILNLSVMKGATCFRVQARANNVLLKGSTAADDEQNKAIDRAIAREILKKL